jgi:long-chain acyl-CoA synthetase
MVSDRPVMNLPYPLTAQERSNIQPLVDYTAINSIPEIWAIARNKFGDTIALKAPHSSPPEEISYSDLYRHIHDFGTGLQALGVEQGDRVALFADNSYRWFIADQGIMQAGAVNVVRSSQAEKEELLYILKDSGTTTLIVEDFETLKKLRDRLDDLPIKLVVMLSDDEIPENETLKIVDFSGLIAAGMIHEFQPVTVKKEDLATLIYTSGTTGRPKGVMLTHGNFLHQITTFGVVVQPKIGDRVLSILPTWHAYERTVEYCLLSQGCTLIYTNLRAVKKDLKQFKPNYMVAVPRLWESIYEGVQKQFREQPKNKQKLINFLLSSSEKYIKAQRILQGESLENSQPKMIDFLKAKTQASLLAPIHKLGEKLVYRQVREATGGQFKQAISGGGSLAGHLETFFEIVGVTLLVGYGLTETAPILTVRRIGHNVRGSSGQPLPGTEIKIVDPETRKDLPQGSRGLVLARGPQIMQGYYQNPEATKKAIDPDGWFDTGDLGMITPDNDLVLTGRAKDTIVLTNGENIEPQPIEDACARSLYIDQIMLVGQDQKMLGALIVPNLEALQQWALSQNYRLDVADLKITAEQAKLPVWDLDHKKIQDLYRQELTREVQNRPGYKIDDKIGVFKLILTPFSMDNGMLTQTLKIRRPIVTEHYQDIISGMFTK